MNRSNTRLVYSTGIGRIKPDKQPSTPTSAPPSDGIIRIRRETKGRKGKGVTTISGLPLDADALKLMAKRLKQLCGTGGSIKDGVIEIQGDHRETIKTELEKDDYTIKFAGG